jgi:peptide/nickel transport system substrate-binding protein
MEIEKVETTVYLERMRTHRFDAAPMGWANPDVWQDNYQVFHSSQADGGSNFVGYKDPEVDRLLEQIRAEFDGDRRSALERRLHRKLFDDQVYLFMTNRMQLDAAGKAVKGIRPSVAWYDLSRIWLEP